MVHAEMYKMSCTKETEQECRATVNFEYLGYARKILEFPILLHITNLVLYYQRKFLRKYVYTDTPYIYNGYTV